MSALQRCLAHVHPVARPPKRTPAWGGHREPRPLPIPHPHPHFDPQSVPPVPRTRHSQAPKPAGRPPAPRPLPAAGVSLAGFFISLPYHFASRGRHSRRAGRRCGCRRHCRKPHPVTRSHLFASAVRPDSEPSSLPLIHSHYSRAHSFASDPADR